MNMTIETAVDTRGLVVTADHVIVTNGHLPEPSLKQAKGVEVGDTVLLQGEGRGIVTKIFPQLLGHTNTLVTSAGTVLANGIQVTTICADVLTPSSDARTTMSVWQSQHAFLGNIVV